MPVGGSSARTGAEAGSSGRPGFRPDVEGLRALAIGAVLLAHAGLPFARGGYIGVDVFFVISGFLITRLLVSELERTGTISLGRFYAYRIKRLLPLSALVLATIVVLSAVLFSPVRNDVIAGDVIAAAGYFVNWHFAAQSVDYFAGGLDVSPVQHFWSLAIEEQFYIVWPGLLLGCTWWWRRSGRSLRRPLWFAVGGVGIASLAYSVVYTAEVPGAAYFSTFARGWELALGGAIALAALPKLSRPLAAGLAFAGFAAIAYAVVAFSEETAFPGFAALVPTLGAAALIVAGSAPTATAPVRLLGTRPFRYVGRISYAWYLWHWPTLVFAAAVWGPLSPAKGVLVVAASWVPTALTHRLIEHPLRLSRTLALFPRRALALGGACTAAAVAAGFALVAIQPSVPTAAAGDVEGASALTRQSTPQKRAKALHPNPRDAGKDRSRLHEDGCFVEPLDTASKPCVYGNPSSSTTVVLLGDSHAMQYFDPLEALARKRDWRLVGLGKAGCTPASVQVHHAKLGRPYAECEKWRESALRRIEDERPALVLVSTSTGPRPIVNDRVLEGKPRLKALEAGYGATLERLRDAASRVVVLKDLPRAPENVAGCVSESLERLDACSFERPGRHDHEAFDRRAAARVKGVQLVDVTPVICPGDVCRAVIGDALVYRDTDHLTGTFALSLAPWIERRLPRLR